MPNRKVLIESALRVEWLTLGWLVIEAAVGVGSGIAAHSLTLIAFGIDSVIELLSACFLLWRLYVELQHGDEFPETIERRAATATAALLVILAVYIAASAAWGLWTHKAQEFSAPGFILAIFAIPIMYALAKAKLRLAGQIGSAALRADAAESIACGYLSAVVVTGLVVQWLTGAWWVDSVSALVLIPFLIHEAKEAFEGD